MAANYALLFEIKIERSVYNRRCKGCFSIRRDCVNCWWILFRRFRKRIETIFSQLCDQFMIRRNYAKTFDGFKTEYRQK